MANQTDQAKSFSGKGIFPYQWAFTLLIPFRNFFLSPKKLIHQLKLQANMKVLEVGSGPGYFSVAVARTLTSGHLVLADIQQEMLDHAKKRLDRRNLHNCEYYLCNGQTFHFEENSFDRIFMVTVLGEITNKAAYLQEFFRILKPEGILSISEQAGDPDKMEQAEIVTLARQFGFILLETFGTKRNYTIQFSKHNACHQ